MIEAPASRELLLFTDPDAMISRIYESELGLGGGTFLVRDMFSDRYIVTLDRVTASRRWWKAISEPGAYPSGNTEEAKSRAIEQAVQYMASKQTVGGSMFKYKVGQMLRITSGIYAGHTFIVEEDGREMSSGIIPMPQYFYSRHGFWYYEDEVEPID